jgi:hypothetical protein
MMFFVCVCECSLDSPLHAKELKFYFTMYLTTIHKSIFILLLQGIPIKIVHILLNFSLFISEHQVITTVCQFIYWRTLSHHEDRSMSEEVH